MSKNLKKRGQSFIEFCMCVPIIMMMVLGLYDICVMNAMRIELQGFTQRAINAYVINSNWTGDGIVEEASKIATSQTVFCLQSSQGGGATQGCSNPKNITFKLGVPSASASKGKWAAGNIACVKGEIIYDRPLYKALLPKGSATITATSCSSVEHDGVINGYHYKF